jgi:general L-amino acid transport system permease protein
MEPTVDIPAVPPTEEPLPIEIPEPSRPPETRLTPTQWVRRNLFATPFGSLLTVVFGVLFVYVAYRLIWFAAITSNWEIIRSNLRLFMIGRFPADQAWRLWGALYLIAAAGGLLGGASATTTTREAAAAGIEYEPPGRWDWVRRYWPVLVAVAVILSQTRTWGPTLLTSLGAALLVAAYWLGRLAPTLAVAAAVVGPAAVAGYFLLGPWATAVVLVVAWFGRRWIDQSWEIRLAVLAVVGSVVVFAVLGLVLGWVFSIALLIAAWFGRSLGRARWLAAVLVGFAAFQLVLDGGAVNWRSWGGLHLTVFATVAGIVLSFPLGVLVALGRRSSLPAVRWINVTYIELIRGVPLITLLFMGSYLVPLFFPTTIEEPSPLTRALIVITLFEAAYVAETVRGGLQSVPRGQYEAAQALGLSPWKVTRLVVLPQALRAVIPAMVGQFISLFKDTSLLSIIGFLELLEVSETAISQPAFQAQRLHTVAFGFVALIFWAGAYTMSRESRRLERRLGIGERGR